MKGRETILLLLVLSYRLQIDKSQIIKFSDSWRWEYTLRTYNSKGDIRMDKSLIEIQKVLGASHILISFSGRFSQGIIQELGEAIKEHMKNEDKPKSKIFNVFSIFIEQAQNINNYFASKKNDIINEAITDSAIVCIGRSEGDYFIWSGNLVENSDVHPLGDQLNLIRGLNKDELKKLYKEQMKKDIQPGQNGAGMGLIDIARKSSVPIEYSFEERDKSFSFYELKAIV